jgi:uncharacterized protein (TIGR04255 family)
MSVDLSQWPRVIFDNNPLKAVVLQVRFPPILALSQAAGVAPFQSAIREVYPRAEAPGQQVTLVIGPAGTMPPVAQPGPWRFLDEQGWVAGLGTDSVSLETTNYEQYEQFEERAVKILEAARSTLGLTERVRLGLRYINEIHHPKARTVGEWRHLLKPELLGVSGGELLGDRVIQTLQQIEVRLDDGMLTVRHGCTVGDGPSPYVIDMDAHDDAIRPFVVDEIVARVLSYRAWIGGFFRSSLQPELYDFLRPREVEG